MVFKLNNLGEKTFEYIKKYVDELITVSEEFIYNSIIYLMEKKNCIVEGVWAVPVAAFMKGKLRVIEKIFVLF